MFMSQVEKGALKGALDRNTLIYFVLLQSQIGFKSDEGGKSNFALKGLIVFEGEDHLRFFDHRFIAIWVLPIALTGIVFEVLFISPTKSTFPFN